MFTKNQLDQRPFPRPLIGCQNKHFFRLQRVKNTTCTKNQSKRMTIAESGIPAAPYIGTILQNLKGPYSQTGYRVAYFFQI